MKGSKELVYVATASSVGMLVLILCVGGLFFKIRSRRQGNVLTIILVARFFNIFFFLSVETF